LKLASYLGSYQIDFLYFQQHGGFEPHFLTNFVLLSAPSSNFAFVFCNMSSSHLGFDMPMNPSSTLDI